MTHHNHRRPELRLRDNLKRELAKVVTAYMAPQPPGDWPNFIRPVATNAAALKALFEWLLALSDWLDGDAEISFSNPSVEVAKAYYKFAQQRAPTFYNARQPCREWLTEELLDDGRDNFDFRPFLLMFKFDLG